MKVFLSHSNADKRLARRLAIDLEDANVDVWLDEWEIGVGEAFAQRIEQGLEEVEFVIVLLTSASVASNWVDREWRHKVQHEAQTNRIAVVPVRGGSCEIPDFLAQRSHADISGSSYPRGFRHLLTILRHYSNESTITFPKTDKDGQPRPENMLPIVTPIGLEVGADLIPLFEPDGNGVSRALYELAPAMFNVLQDELGFPFPGVRVRGNDSDMPPRSALILIDEIPEVLLDVGRDEVLVDADVEELGACGINGEPRDDAATGRVRARIAAGDRAAAEAAGFRTWDAAEYLFVALEGVLRRMARLFLDIDITRRLVDSVEATSPELVAQTVPKTLSWFELTDVLQRLVDEEIGVGDMQSVLQSLSERPPDLTDTVMMAERARHSLRRQITRKFAQGRNTLPVFLLDRQIEVLISSAIQRTSAGLYLALAPEHAQDILAAIREVMSSQVSDWDGVPILVTDVEVRAYVRRLVSVEFPALHVLSREDLMPEIPIQVVAPIRLKPTPAATPTGEGPSA